MGDGLVRVGRARAVVWAAAPWVAVGATEAAVGLLRDGGWGSVVAGAAWAVVGVAIAGVAIEAAPVSGASRAGGGGRQEAGGGRVPPLGGGWTDGKPGRGVAPWLGSPWLPGLVYLLGSVLVALDLRGVALILAAVGALAVGRVAVGWLQGRVPVLAWVCTVAATLGGLAARDGLPTRDGLATLRARWSHDAHAAVASTSAAPTVLLLTVDTLRADATGPTFAALAERGLSGPTWSTAPWTLPALASLHTGLTPYAHGALVRAPVRGNTRIAGFDAETLAERYAARGYATAAFVENPQVSRARGFARGFQTWDSPDDRDPPRALLLDPLGLGADLRPLVQHGRDPDARVDRALAWLRDQRGAAFVWVHLLGPHLPLHHADTSPGTALGDALGDAPTRLNLDYLRRGSMRWTPALREEVRAAYRAEALRADAALGRLVGALPDAVVVYTADHGEEFGEHDGWEHGHALWEEVVRVPLAMAGPGISVGTFGAASLVDVAATLDPTVAGDGVDLRGVAASAVTSRGPIFLQDTLYLEEREGVIDGPWKLVRTLAGDQHMLFDLAMDPREERDVAAGNPDVVRRLAGMLDAERARLGDTPTGTIGEKVRALGYVE